jgi:hypothetical protein
MPSNFPNDPAINDTHTIGNITWRWNGVAWIALPGNGSTLSLNDLSDVTITTPTSNEVLKYDGSEWKNSNSLDGGAF